VKTLTANSAIVAFVGLIVLVALAVWWFGGLGNFMGAGKAQAAAAAGAFPSPDNFVVLASTYGNSGATTITGDLGYTPGPGVPPP
jgi:hypothetical protein